MRDVTSKIRHHIDGKSLGELFTTREFLSYGRRGAVDKALFLMVRKGRILRVARGVFMKPGSPQPSVEYVARTKAESFGRKILAHGSAAAAALGITVELEENAFACTGRSSSFRYGAVRVKLVGIAPRKMHLGDSLVGLILRAFWYLGYGASTQETVRTSARHLKRPDREALRNAAPLMSWWMANLWFWNRYPRDNRLYPSSLFRTPEPP